MPDIPRAVRPLHSNKPTSPEDYPTSPPQPSGDYSYTVEIVMRMQETIGQMKAAVDGLKAEAGEQRSKLDTIGKDVHSAKVLFAVFGSVLTLVITGGIALLGIGLNAYFNFHKR